MTHHQHDVICSFFVLVVLLVCGADLLSVRESQRNVAHLPEAKFSFNEYSEYPDNEEKDKGWDQLSSVNHNVALGTENHISTEIPPRSLDVFDKSIVWDSEWASELKLGQVSAVTVDPDGNIAIFHRGDRVWGFATFDAENRFDPRSGAIRQDTILLLDKSGKKISQWGRNMFYLPHGLTIDSSGNYWITDVAMHQVFKFDGQEIYNHRAELQREQSIPETPINPYDNDALFKNSVLKPSLILGEAFVPGNEKQRFCKPTAVAVQENGDFFVSDGYCNSRIIKFNKNGERILEWGRHWGMGEPVYTQPPPPNAFFIPHGLSLAEELNSIFVADRENGRILSFFASNGSFIREYKSPVIGTKIYSVAYAFGKLYLVNGPDPYLSDLHVHGFVLDVDSGKLVSQFGPNKSMERPHDIAVNTYGPSIEIYVVELDSHRVYRFVDERSYKDSSTHSISRHQPAPLTDMDSKDLLNTAGNSTATLVLSLVTASVILIAFCVITAAVVARCQKRGCLLTRKRTRWEAERKENFKLSSLLEGRKGKGFKCLEKRPNTRDFSKLNTEPETSDDERPENSLTKII